MASTNSTVLSAISTGYVASLLRVRARFERAARDPRRAQEKKLADWLARHVDTAYGREYRLSTVRSVRDFQERLPVVDYDALAPWVERIAAGEVNVLCPDRVDVFEESSGSTTRRKLIPYTNAFRAEFGEATGPWIFDMYRSRPALLGCSSYWSISPASRERETTAAGIPIGFEDDTEYFDPLSRWALSKLISVPSRVGRIKSMDAWRFETAKCLLEDARLGFISVWNPTFLTLLMEFIGTHSDELLKSLSEARADALRRAIALGQEGALRATHVWPQLKLISCWTDGHARDFVAPMRRYFPGVEVQPKGLLATEGVVSFPVGSGSEGAVFAVNSHFVEFLDVEDTSARPLLVHELRTGARYSPILTTANGFARYHLKDVIECVGHYRALPRFRFIARMDKTSDICGEKLDALLVENVLERVTRKEKLPASFILLAPSLRSHPAYVAYVESPAGDVALHRFADELETALQTQAYHYRYARALGQLDRLRVVRVEGGWSRYQEKLVELGAKLGNIKPTRLDSRPIWDSVFLAGDRVQPTLSADSMKLLHASEVGA